ncbi:hypothetical protein KY284_000455 [Solanum tuberosum]|nr:hypothetical protein KY284_000455 [Solanum tuberosum]
MASRPKDANPSLYLSFPTFSCMFLGICRQNEQRALESLKKEVDDPLDIPSSWVVGKDCCEWEGVVCNNLTCRVIGLHISYLRIDNLEWLSSLLSLENLEMYHVDLREATNWLQV